MMMVSSVRKDLAMGQSHSSHARASATTSHALLHHRV
eukprot:CAMPEP_0206262322 /NCGR_PEP_ID=MMETSP0047_2-20121206/28171_1 /ASSEMBLY_ACC=CAM_ASM_000192 /TAXON_ID=195065 /ORGANISM="Chroomonas mesostigmatica_cf, Strain CCMP1168" /LENGTH=36 /DNA_ID= /DNA_START= /DNA_END= /DNA_ORIENTATION=